MRQRLLLLLIGLVASLGLLAGALTLGGARAAAQSPCVIFFPATTSSAVGAIVCQPVPPCGTFGVLTVIVIGTPGTTGTAACGTAGVSCTTPPSGFCTTTVAVPAQPPGTLLACIVTKPANPPPPSITLATCF